jgi:hypothetical protein
MSAEFKQQSYLVLRLCGIILQEEKINYFILHNSTPQKYKVWLQHIIDNYKWESMPEPFFIY